jgi:hypothetical protein
MDVLRALAGVSVSPPQVARAEAPRKKAYAYETLDGSHPAGVIAGPAGKRPRDEGNEESKRLRPETATVITSRESSLSELLQASKSLRKIRVGRVAFSVLEGGALEDYLDKSRAKGATKLAHEIKCGESEYADHYVDGSGIFNTTIRDGFVSETSHGLISGLLEFIEKHSDVYEGAVLWRGVDLWSDIAIGDTICDAAFMSKSTDLAQAMEFAVGDHPGLLVLSYPGKSSHLMFNENETEVITYPGEKFRVDDAGIAEAGTAGFWPIRVLFATYVGNMYGESPPLAKSISSAIPFNPAIDAAWEEITAYDAIGLDPPDKDFDGIFLSYGKEGSPVYLWTNEYRGNSELTQSLLVRYGGPIVLMDNYQTNETFRTRFHRAFLAGLVHELVLHRGFEGVALAHSKTQHGKPTGVEYTVADSHSGIEITHRLEREPHSESQMAEAVRNSKIRFSLNGVNIERVVVFRKASLAL